MSNKTLTLHPDPAKKGVNIDTDKYAFIRERVEKVVQKYQPLTPTELFEHMQQYSSEFDGKIGWYTESVKLDLEARRIIAHDRKTRQITLL